MAKKATVKRNKEEVLEDILFGCRDSLRGRASLTDKRDMLLTLVFLKFISERYHDRCDEIRKENEDDPEFAEMLIASKRSAFGEKGVFMLIPETDWESLKLVEPKSIAVALDDATTKLTGSESQLKGALPTALFVNSGTESNVIKQVMDDIEENGWNLVPSRYIEFVDRDNELDFNTALADAGAKVKDFLARQKENRQSLINAFKAIGYNIK